MYLHHQANWAIELGKHSKSCKQQSVNNDNRKKSDLNGFMSINLHYLYVYCLALEIDSTCHQVYLSGVKGLHIDMTQYTPNTWFIFK